MKVGKKRKKGVVISKPYNLQRIAYLNTGTLEDAQKFNLVAPEDDVKESLKSGALKFLKTLF